MSKILKITYILIFLLLVGNFSYAQYESVERQKAEKLFEIFKYLIWEGDAELDYFKLGVINCSDDMIKELDKAKPNRYATGIRVDIVQISDYDQINETVKIIYVGKENYLSQNDVPIISKKCVDNSIALFTDRWIDDKKVMFNFTETSGRVGFQYSKKKITQANIAMNDDFEKNGGLGGFDLNSEEQVRKVENELQIKQIELEEKEKKVEEKNKELAEKTREIAEKDKDLKKQTQQIEKQNNELIATKEEIARKQTEINKQKRVLAEQTAKVDIKERELLRKQKDIEVLKNKILDQQEEYEAQTELLKEQRKKVDEEKAKIAVISEEVEAKKAELRRLNFTIQMQRWALGVFIVLLVVIVILLFFIYRNFREKKRQNILLEEKNAEIEAQAVELSNANAELEKLSIVASETVNAVAILDSEGNFDWVNAGYTKIYGYTLQLLKNELGDNILKTSTNPYIKELLHQVVKQKKSVKFETYVQTRHENSLWVQTTLTPIVNTSGEVTKLVSIDSDITEIKEAEEQIRKQNEKIVAQSHELEEKNFELAKLSLVAEETDNAVIIASESGEIEWVNPGFEKLHETNLEIYKEQHGDNIINPELSPDILDLIGTGLQEKRSVTYSTKTKTGKGNDLWLQTTLTPMYDSDGSLTKLFAIDADITQIKIAEEKIAKQNQNITNSIVYASRIQTAVLPPREYIKTLLPEHFIMFRPRDIVSGDYYWVSNIDEKVLFTAADSTGHGVPGAFMSMLGVAFLNEITGKLPYEDLRADIILNQLRNKVKLYLRQTGKAGESKDGMDICFCVYDREENELSYAGAHNPLYLVRNGEMNQYQPDEMPIGIYHQEKASFTNHSITPQKGDMLYLFSDGYPDQFGIDPNAKRKRRRKFMIKRFRMFLTEISGEHVDVQKQKLEDRFDEWRGDIHQVDDVIVMGVRI